MSNDEIKTAFTNLDATNQAVVLALIKGMELGKDGVKPIVKHEPKGFDIELWKDPKYYPHYCNQEEKPNDRKNENQERA